MKNKYCVWFVLSMVCLFTLTGCTARQPNMQDRPTIAVSIVPQQTFVQKVASDAVEVVVLVPPGSSPANYEPTPQSMRQLADATLYFTIGVPTETANILPRIESDRKVRIVSLADAAAEVYPMRTFDHGGTDPHVWLSPKRVMVMIDTIEKELSAQFPNLAEQFAQNAQAYKDELSDLHETLKNVTDRMEQKAFIVFHPAFGYLADDYGLTQVALEQDGKEASPQRMAELIDFAKRENIKAIFYQAEMAKNQAQAFAEQISGATVQLAPLSPEYIENLKNMVSLLQQVSELEDE